MTRGLTGGVVAGRCLVRGLLVVSLLLVAASGPKPASAAEARAVEAGASTWQQVSAGLRHTCAIHTSGRLYCWGSASSGQLGDGAPSSYTTTPVEVVGGGTDWATVSAGDQHTCAVKTTGRLYCWGWDGSGRLGNGGPNTRATTPVEVAGGATDWATVTAGDQHTCAVKTTGRLYCWGWDGSGRLGNGGPNTPASTPVEVARDATDWATVDAGRAHGCATRTSGLLYCWGWDQFGQLGNGRPNRDRPVPVRVAGGATDWTAVGAGGFGHTCAVRANGRASCWGTDGNGRLGNGGTARRRYLPTEVAGRAANWAGVDAGHRHSCAVRTNGRLYCWGHDGRGQLGDGKPRADRTTPVQVHGGFANWASVSAGGSHTCAIKTTGRLYCWGGAYSGQLGNGDTSRNRSVPVQVFAP